MIILIFVVKRLFHVNFLTGEAVRQKDCNTQTCMGPVIWSANGTYVSVSMILVCNRVSSSRQCALRLTWLIKYLPP